MSYSLNLNTVKNLTVNSLSFSYPVVNVDTDNIINNYDISTTNTIYNFISNQFQAEPIIIHLPSSGSNGNWITVFNSTISDVLIINGTTISHNSNRTYVWVVDKWTYTQL